VNAAATLLAGDYIKRDELDGLSVDAARVICTRATAQMKQLDKMAKVGGRPAAEIAAAKQQVGKAVAKTAKESRKGEVKAKDLRGRVDGNTYRFAQEAKREQPLFEPFGKRLRDDINRIRTTGSAAKRLKETKAALGGITQEEDWQAVRGIQHELRELAKWAEKQADALDATKVPTPEPRLIN
jgi:hypothetical protein